MKTCKEKALEWGLSTRAVNNLCKLGKIPGIAQESIFSGLNNLNVNSIMDEDYDEFFGFTQQEVHKMLEYYGVSDKEDELKNWYDGYLFGNKEIYNPWSVINYVSKNCVPQAYWVNTGKNEILEDVLQVATDDDIIQRLYALLQENFVLYISWE